MKIYEVTTIELRGNEEFGDEFQSFLGVDFTKAQLAKEEALADFSRLTSYDKEHYTVEARVYDIPDDTDILDIDSVVDAMCECTGYNLF